MRLRLLVHTLQLRRLGNRRQVVPYRPHSQTNPPPLLKRIPEYHGFLPTQFESSPFTEAPEFARSTRGKTHELDLDLDLW